MSKDKGPQEGDLLTHKVDDSISMELEQDATLYEGEYLIYVPPGQRATVRYTLAVSTKETDHE